MQMKKILSQKRRKRRRRRLKKTKQRPEKKSRHQLPYLPILSAGSSLFSDSVIKNRSIICLYFSTVCADSRLGIDFPLPLGT
jgi:hypothetical protein